MIGLLFFGIDDLKKTKDKCLTYWGDSKHPFRITAAADAAHADCKETMRSSLGWCGWLGWFVLNKMVFIVFFTHYDCQKNKTFNNISRTAVKKGLKLALINSRRE